MSKPSPYADPQPNPALSPEALSRAHENEPTPQADPNYHIPPKPTVSALPTNPDTVFTSTFRDKLGQDLFIQAVKQSDLPPRKKLVARLAYRVPSIREDVDDFIEAKVSENGDVNTMANGDIIRIIIENLPAIIALLLKLFGG